MKPTARSFLLDLLSTLRRGTMPVSALVESAGLFGIAENSVRVALTRLLAAGQVERDARGRYRLGEAARAVEQRVTSWRDVERRLRSWDGSWVGVIEGRGAGRVAGRQRERALRMLGLRALRPALCVRPNNLRGGVAALRGELARLGLPPGDLVVELRELDDVTDARSRELWESEELGAAHRALRREIEESARRLDALPVERSMVESFLLGGRAIRQLVLDPLLPDAIAPGDERRALLERMRAYDRQGRTAWSAFLARYDVPHRRAPADTRLCDEQMVAGTDRLPNRGVLR